MHITIVHLHMYKLFFICPQILPGKGGGGGKYTFHKISHFIVFLFIHNSSCSWEALTKMLTFFYCSIPDESDVYFTLYHINPTSWLWSTFYIIPHKPTSWLWSTFYIILHKPTSWLWSTFYIIPHKPTSSSWL